jgi:hypothetical protein
MCHRSHTGTPTGSLGIVHRHHWLQLLLRHSPPHGEHRPQAVSNLPALTTLNLSWCHEATDEALRVMSNCSALMSLGLAACRALMDVGVRALNSLPAITTPTSPTTYR